MNKGRNRRKNLADSIQRLAKTTNQSAGHMIPPVRPGVARLENGFNRSEVAMMPPPNIKRPQRKSLPTEVNNKDVENPDARGTKRKRNNLSAEDTMETPKLSKSIHRRSQTVGDSVMSAPPHVLSQSQYKSRIDPGKVPQGSMLNDILMKQARRFAPTAKTDTTRTDYFRLKALGIDPDTPIVPKTKKRSRADSESESSISSKSQRMSPSASPLASPSLAPSTPRVPQTPPGKPSAKDDDEELFAQLRSVREALAESETWMQNERQSIERSVTATPRQSSRSSPSNETAAQRRLREIKERGPQPSRSEVRLRAMGDKALLPKGFWDGEGMGKSLAYGKKKEEDLVQSSPSRNGENKTNGALGFAALSQNDTGFGRHREVEKPAEEKMGASVEDAIEL